MTLLYGRPKHARVALGFRCHARKFQPCGREGSKPSGATYSLKSSDTKRHQGGSCACTHAHGPACTICSSPDRQQWLRGASAERTFWSGLHHKWIWSNRYIFRRDRIRFSNFLAVQKTEKSPTSQLFVDVDVDLYGWDENIEFEEENFNHNHFKPSMLELRWMNIVGYRVTQSGTSVQVFEFLQEDNQGRVRTYDLWSTNKVRHLLRHRIVTHNPIASFPSQGASSILPLSTSCGPLTQLLPMLTNLSFALWRYVQNRTTLFPLPSSTVYVTPALLRLVTTFQNEIWWVPDALI